MKKILPWICILFLAWYISNNWFQLMLIQGESMAPAYKHMQLVVLNKYDKEFHRGDVVAFWCQELSCVLVKRIVAVPGDKVVIQNGTLYVNDCVSEIYSEQGIFTYAGWLEEPCTLQAKEYLMLGDNIELSKDSRYSEVGIVTESQIYGKIVSQIKDELNQKVSKTPDEVILVIGWGE